MSFQAFTINSEHTLEACKNWLDKTWHEKKWMQLTPNFDRGRTVTQNSALHVYCGLLATAFNEAGLYYTFTFNGKESQCEWTPETVKERIWRTVQKAVTNKDSSTRLTTKECTKVYENVNLLTAEKFGISIDWPVRGGR